MVEYQPWPNKQNDGRSLEKSLTKADGIAAQINVVLYGLGWIPLSYKKWISPDKQEWNLECTPDSPFPIMTVSRERIKTDHTYMTNKSRKHYQGDSLGNIIPW